MEDDPIYPGEPAPEGSYHTPSPTSVLQIEPRPTGLTCPQGYPVTLFLAPVPPLSDLLGTHQRSKNAKFEKRGSILA